MKKLKAIIFILGRLPFYIARAWPARRSDQRGTAMVEAMAAIAITASAGVAALSLVSIASVTSNNTSAKATASWVAASQAEMIHAAAYVATPGEYGALTAPSGFIVSNTTSDILSGEPAIQLVTIAVTKAGKEIVSVALVKVDR